MLSEMEEGVSPSGVNILQAMRMADKAWNIVSSSTIMNSFKKAGFVKDHESTQIIYIDHPDENCAENDWNRLTRLMHLDNMEFNDFVVVDDGVIVCGQWEDNDIIAQTKSSNVLSEEEEICHLQPNVTNKLALFAVDTLRRYVESQPNMSEDTFKAIVHLESVIDKISYSSLKQTTIESFFK